jgi:rubrerythrin
MELAKLFRPLMELEYQMHRMYMWFSDMFQDNPDAYSLFRLMAREELQHKERVQNQFYLVVERSDEYADADVDLEGLFQLIDLIKGQVDRRNPMTLKDALTTSIQFEKTAAESHYRYIIAKSNPVLREMIVLLANADREHLARLEMFFKRIFHA